MTNSLPPQGTHFSDGLRTGPILGSVYTAGASVLTPSTVTTSPADGQPNGIFNTPMSLLNVIPATAGTAVLAALQRSPGNAAGYLSLVSVNSLNATVVTDFQSGTTGTPITVLQLDTPRNTTVTQTGGSAAVVITQFGFDQYKQPMVETITHPGGASTVAGKKAFAYLYRSYISADNTTTGSIGVGDVFGLPYLLPSINYLQIPEWNLRPDVKNTTLLGAGPLTTTAGSAIVRVTSVAHGLSTSEVVTLVGLVVTDTITAANLNVSSSITVVDADNFLYSAGAAGAAGVAGGGGNFGSYITSTPFLAGTVVVGSQAPATATTGDVYGTYAPSTPSTGARRLFINYYSPSGDARNSYPSVQTALLSANPLNTTSGNKTVGVFAPAHNLTTGQYVTIAGATTTGGILAANLNIYAAVTVVDSGNFTYTSDSPTNATGTTTGGGTAVTMTPGKGNLYQVAAGRFGVAQYTTSLI